MPDAADGPEGGLAWDAVNWRAHEQNVARLRQRIFTATRDGDWPRVRNLREMMLRSWSDTLVSVRQVTQRNAGRATAGVDGVVALDGPARVKAAVRVHTESTRSQYALADKAAALGWARSGIEVIGTGLGISGKWGVAREGSAELVTRVCSGEVGAIFGIEITRLARSGADVARLAEFARITGTLLIDPDGVYDPADVNDRVLPGLQGGPWGKWSST